MSRIGISLHACDHGKSGIGQYMIELLQAIEREDQSNHYYLFVSETDNHLFDLPSDRFQRILVPKQFDSAMMSILWHQTLLIWHIRKLKIDVFFFPAANRRLTWTRCIPTIGTIHDLCQFRTKGKYDPFRMFYVKHLLPLQAKRLTMILTPSQNSKEDVISFYNLSEEKIHVIYNGINQIRYQPLPSDINTDELRKQYQLPRNYLVYVSRLEHPGKNHVKLITAYSLLREKGYDGKLLLVGSDWNGADIIHEVARASPYSRDIIMSGFVENEALPNLVRLADIFVYPSLYEGFGIPVIEAMACGVPVACSSGSSLSEIANGHARLFDPEIPEDIANQVLHLLTHKKETQLMALNNIEYAQTFSWKRAAQQTLLHIKASLKK